MLFKFAFAILLSISVSHCHLIPKAVDEGNTESSALKMFPSDEDWSRALDGDTGLSKTEGKNLKSTFGPRSFAMTCVNGLIRTGDLTLQERLSMCKNWIKNRDQVILLHQDMSELSGITHALSEQSSQSECLRADDLTQDKIDEMSKSIQYLELIGTKLKILKDWRVIVLAEIDQLQLDVNVLAMFAPLEEEASNTPAVSLVSVKPKASSQYLNKVKDLAGPIAKIAWINFGNSIVDDLKQLINRHQLIYDESKIENKPISVQWIQWWEYTLKSIDFLFKNNFIDQNTVRNFFRSPGLIAQIVCYTKHRLEKVEIHPNAQWSYLTKHWYWHRLHECFKALSQEEEAEINAYVILFSRRHDALMLNRIYPSAYSETYKSILGTFESPEDLLFSRFMHDLHSSRNLPLPISEVQVLNSNQFLKLIDFLENDAAGEAANDRYSKESLEKYLYHIWQLIEDYLLPRIKKEISPEIPNFDKLANSYNFHRVKFQSKRRDLHCRAVICADIMKEECTFWMRSIYYKTEFNEFLTEAREMLDQFHVETSRLFPQSAHEARASETYRKIMDTARDIQDLVLTLEGAYATFK